MRKGTWTAAAVGAMVAAGTALTAPVSAYQSGGFSEGAWEGYLGMDASYTFATDEGPVPVDYQTMGSFAGATTAGTFSGEWELDVFSQADVGGTIAEANALGFGTFNGPTDIVELELDSVDVTEPTIGMTLSFTAEELPGASGGWLQVEGGDCNFVQGSWTISFGDQDLLGQFTAVRAGDELTDADVARTRRQNQTELTARGRAILTDLQSGIISVEGIRTLVEDMEGALGFPGLDECGGGSNRSFRSSSTELIDSILFELAGSADELDARTLIELILAGFRSGSFGANPDTRDFWMGEYERAVEAAIASGDVAVIGQFSAASRLLGRTDEARLLDDLISDLGTGS